MKSVTIRAEIPESRELRVVLPEDFPIGPVEVVVTGADEDPTEEGHSSKIRTFGDLLRSGFVGSWSDREDITDSVEFARKLREEAWTRHHEIDDAETAEGGG